MKKKLLLSVCLLSALCAMAQIENYTLPDGKVIKVDRSVFPDWKYEAAREPQPAEYTARRKARAKQGRVKLPEYVYNGDSKYFPPIFNQDGGSCGSACSEFRQRRGDRCSWCGKHPKEARIHPHGKAFRNSFRGR